MTREEYFGDWSKVIDTIEAENIVKRLLANSPDTPICPLPKNIFKAFRLCSLHNLRVVLLGQDPYNNLHHNQPVATGLAFANSNNTPNDSYSPSLEVLKESVIDPTVPHGIINFDPSLEKWEEQGVLLLNSALSCQAGKPGSHTLLWRPFMTSLLTNLSKLTTGIVYVLMGSVAQTLEPYIDSRLNHIIRIRHPSWYARNKTSMPSDIWWNINDILTGQNGDGINWYNEL